MEISLILSAVIGYFIGSISVSILLSRFVYHSDVRAQGSGNAGATNAARVYGMQAGVLTFAGDFVKGILSMSIGSLLAGTEGMALAGAAGLIGHCFPIYFKFKGGKAVSTGAAIGLMIDWRLFLITVAVFALVAFLTRIASVSSMSAGVALAIFTPFFTTEACLIALSIFGSLLVITMHRANIKRLIHGEEKKFRAGKRS